MTMSLNLAALITLLAVFWPITKIGMSSVNLDLGDLKATLKPLVNYLVEPLEYDVNLVLLNRLRYIAGNVNILVSFDENKLPSTPKAGSKLIERIKNLSKAKCLIHHRSRVIRLSLDNCYDIVDIELHHAKSASDMKSTGGVKVDIEWHRDFRRNMVEISTPTGANLPSDGLGQISIRYTDRSEDPNNPTCKRREIVTRGSALYKPERCRELIPCFEDSSLRAKVSLSLTVEDNDSTRLLTNTPALHEAERLNFQGYNLLQQEFEKTLQPISVEDLLIVSGSFDEPLVGSKARVIAPAGYREQTRPALEFLDKAMGWIEEYTQHKYPLASYQLVILPTVPDEWHSNGGLGASIVAPSIILDQNTDSREAKIGTAFLLAVEVARQWFGNVLRPRDKSSVWITESLATFTAMRLVNELMPELKIYEYFGKSAIARMTERDSKFRLPPITSTDASQHYDQFNTMRVLKGAAIIDMLVRNVDREFSRFDQSVRMMFDKRSSPIGIDVNDLIKVFANRRYDQHRIMELLNPWLHNRGFPVVHVTLSERGKVCLIQAGDQKKDASIWPLPLKVEFAKDDKSISSVWRVGLSKFLDNQGVVCLPSSFRLLKNSTGWVDVSSHTENALTYFKVRYLGELAKHHRRPAAAKLFGKVPKEPMPDFGGARSQDEAHGPHEVQTQEKSAVGPAQSEVVEVPVAAQEGERPRVARPLAQIELPVDSSAMSNEEQQSIGEPTPFTDFETESDKPGEVSDDD